MNTRVVAIAAISKDTRAMGIHNDLLWHIPGDLPRFKSITEGHPVIMGYKTFLSLPGALKNRTNIVMSLEPIEIEGVEIAYSPEEALAKAENSSGGEIVYIIGGGMIYNVMLPHTDELLLTLVDESPEADVFFPEYEHLFTQTQEDHQEVGGLSFSYTHWVRTNISSERQE